MYIKLNKARSLRKKYLKTLLIKPSRKFRSGDYVEVMTGDYKGVRGYILYNLRNKHKVLVQNVGSVKKIKKFGYKSIFLFKPLSVSNIMHSVGLGVSRVFFKTVDQVKSRFYVINGEPVKYLSREELKNLRNEYIDQISIKDKQEDDETVSETSSNN